MTFVELDGTQLFYDLTGEGEETIVLGHAGFVDSRMWDGQVQALESQYRVLRYDMQGFGRSDAATAPVARRAQLLAMLQKLGIAKAHFIGSSMSGALFLNFALEHPEMVKSLVVANAVPDGFEMQGEPPRYLMEMFGAAQTGDVELTSELQVRIWFDGMYREPEEVDATVREKVAQMNRIPVQNNTFFIADSQPIEPLDPSAVNRLGEIACPVLVIDSTLDHPEVQRAAALMAERMPNAQYVTIEGAAHMPNMEKPDEFNRAVAKFLQG